ncbi:MAG: Calx-beta domain-containing protein [Pirellulaceae bacterium]
MLFSSWLRNWKRPSPAARRRTQPSPRQRFSFRPRVETLENRWLLSTLAVTNTSDSGPGSLRDTIAAAESGDTIVFSLAQPQPAVPTITLTSGQLTLTEDLTIQGPGTDQLTISGNYDSRIFEVAPGATVILSGLTITKGFGVTYGGGILNSGTLTVTSSMVAGNGASYGGGVYNAGGTLNVGNSALDGNYADGLFGGGIYNAGGTVAVSNSTLRNNQSLYGGGIYNNGGMMTFTSSTISDNWAHFDYFMRGSYGGGIFNTNGAVILSNSIISGNAAAVAGGIYNTTSGTVTVVNSSSITANNGGPYDWVAAEDVNNLGVVYLDDTSTIGVLSGNPAIPLESNAPQLQIRDVTIAEGNTGTTSATFTVTLSAASTETITVAYATTSGTATAGSDYQSASGTLTISAGQTTGTITVLVTSDRLGEANETFFVNLSSPTNATIADGQGVGTIVDDEPRISISDVTKSEGKKGRTTLFTFTVTLSAAYDQPVTMSYSTVNGTATTGDGDYIAKTGTLTFAPGETTKTITIEVKGDSKREADETFYLDLFGNSVNSLFTKNRGTGTILNDG